MPNDSVGSENSENGKTNQPRWWLLYVVIAASALGGLSIIWLLCLNYIPHEANRVQIFLAVSVNYLILMAMFVQAHITQRQWKAMSDGLKQTEALADAAKAANDFTETSFYLAERAYLTVRNLRPTRYVIGNSAPTLPLREGDDPKFAFEIINGGRTPAFELVGYVYTTADEPLDDASLWQSRFFFDEAIIMPNDSPVKVVSSDNIAMPKGFYDVRFDEIFYWVRIDLEYWDIGGGSEPHKAISVYRLHREFGLELVYQEHPRNWLTPLSKRFARSYEDEENGE